MMDYRETHASIETGDNSERGDHAIIEVENGNDPVAISIKETLDSLFPLSSECCIYTVPENLRKINAEAYTPIMVSIGPLHRGVERLKAMEEHKFRYLNSFVRRSGLSLEDYVKFIRQREEQVRNCYAENVKLESDEFVKMILVDGCFVVELILRFNLLSSSSAASNYLFLFDDMPGDGKHLKDIEDHVDRIFDKPGLLVQIKRDLLLLENQLPFFVLEDLFHQWRVSSGRRGDISFIELCPVFFKNITNMDKLPDGFSGDEVSAVKHFVHFLLLHYLPPSAVDKDTKYAYVPIEIPPTATELHEAGIRFKKGTNTHSLDVQFVKGVLEISHLPVYNMTETILRNLIAFEQCHHLDGTIMDYMQLMDGLINTPNDVDLLIKAKIIKSHLGSSEEVSKMINNIRKEVYMSQKLYFHTLCKNLNNYCKAPQHRWKAKLRRDYFNTPWKIVYTIAAVILLVLTFIQAVCSILSM